MNYVVYSDNGRIAQTGSTTPEGFKAQNITGHKLLEIAEDIHPDAWYVENEKLKPIAPAPSSCHRFNYTNKQWELHVEVAWAACRFKRDTLLTETDWVVTKATEAGEGIPAPWVAYRQALRDMSDQADPGNLVWPTKPT